MIASRGYRGRARDPVVVVSDGDKVLSSVEAGGDESLVLAAHAVGVPVLVGRDRRRVGRHAVARFDCEILVLDDGFHHHRLARDFDLVCIDGTAGVGNGRVVPAGPLREPLASLRRADAVCVVDGRDTALLDPDAPRASSGDWTGALAAGIPVVAARRQVRSVAPLGGGASEPPESLRGRSVGCFAGIGRPAALRRTVEGLGARVVAERRFPDHHRYAPSDLAFVSAPSGGAARGAAIERPDLWLTTEKDALKILPDWVPPDRVAVVRIDVELEGEAAFLDTLEAALRRAGRLEPSREPLAS